MFAMDWIPFYKESHTQFERNTGRNAQKIAMQLNVLRLLRLLYSLWNTEYYTTLWSVNPGEVQ